MQIFQVSHDLRRPHVVRVNREVLAQASAGRNVQAADDRQPLAALPAALHRPLPARCPGAAVQWLQLKARFVEEDDASFSPGSPFLIRGQSSRRHRSMAASSRSRARRRGFCGEKPKSCSNRPTWSTWYVTPNVSAITCPTRPQVHRSVKYPAASGPRNRISTSSSCCESLSLRRGPGCGFAASPTGPCAFKARFQRRTLEIDASTQRATSANVISSLKRRAAIRRRTSNSAAVPAVLIPPITHASTHPVQSRRSGE